MRNLLESVISVPGEIRKIEKQQRENIKEKEKIYYFEDWIFSLYILGCLWCYLNIWFYLTAK